MTIASKGVMMTKIFAFILLLAVSFSLDKPTFYPNGLNTSKLECDDLVVNGENILDNITTTTLNASVISADTVKLNTISEPTATEGKLWYDTVTKTMNYYNGSAWVYW